MSESQVTGVRALTPEEERLADWLAEQHLKSPDRLEAAARQIVGLVTGLVGLLVGVAAVTEQPLPPYMAWPCLRWLMVASLVLLLVSLAAGMVVLWPRRVVYSPHKMAEQRAVFEGILRRKARALGVAIVCFALGIALLAAVLALAVLYV